LFIQHVAARLRVASEVLIEGFAHGGPGDSLWRAGHVALDAGGERDARHGGAT
jgi:hypothetical protein